jgi:hypothetical protein
MSLTPEQFKKLFPRASRDTIANSIGTAIRIKTETASADGIASAGSEVSSPKPKPRARKRLQGEVPREASSSARYFIRIESRRRRLTDEDNLCAKYHIDGLRYAGLIPDDAPNTVKLSVFQTKVQTAEDEVTIIEIFPPGQWPEGVK